MNLFDRVKINIHHLEDELYEHMLHYNNESGTIIGINYTQLPSYIKYTKCYSTEYIIQFDDVPDDGNMACVLPEECLTLI